MGRAADADERLAPAPVDQEQLYGSTGYDYDKAGRTAIRARVEHDVNRRLTLRNQTRQRNTRREAVSTIQNVAAYNPVTNLVTIARQATSVRTRWPPTKRT